MAQAPALLQGPEPVETTELHFKLSCKLKIFETETKYEGGHCCVLAVSQYYGLIFVGHSNGFSIIKTKALSPAVDSEKFPRRDIILKLRPTHISVDFSQKILAVACSSKNGSMLVFYEIAKFAEKEITPLNLKPLVKIEQNIAVEVLDVAWQPVVNGSITICLSDGSVLALSQGAQDGPTFMLPSTTQATCFCWSPKGKQIVIGNARGTLSQYKPDLKLVKSLPPPPLFNDGAMVVSVLWISSFQFAVAYNDRNNPESFPVITIVNAAKNDRVNIINYDDITYSSTIFRNHQIYMSHQSAWNLIFVSSANSVEVAVLHSKDGSAWEQWLLGDASRAELPLNPDKQETFPLGWAFDFTSQETIPWGEGSLPPMPRLLLMSDEGILCVFNIVNAAENAPQVCTAPEGNLDDSLFTGPNKMGAAPILEPPKPLQTTSSLLGSPPTFGGSKPTFTFEASPGFGGFGTTKPPTVLPQGTPIIFTRQQPQQVQQQPQQLQQQPQQVQQQPQQLQQQPQQVQQQPQQLQQQPQQLQRQPQQLQQQPQQLQLQPQLQQQTQAIPTQPVAMGGFKLSTPQFGAAPTFSFGTNSTSLLSSKPDLTGSVATPKMGQPQPISLTMKPVPAHGDFFSGKTPPQSTPIKQPEILAEKTVSAPAPAAKKPEEVPENVTKSEVQPAQGESPAPGTPELAAVDDSVYLSALEEEIEHFNSELQQLSAKVCNINVNVGTEEDKAKMKKSIDGLYDFCKELKETTKGQSAEIHTVVVDLMEAFAWLEDAKSRNLQKKNPSYIELKKSEELDPLSARHMNEIDHLKYYIENQLKQLTSYLEKEWMDHQENYRNEVKGRMAVPPLEEVHKTMVYQLKILHKQKALVEELKEKIAIKKRKNKPDSFAISAISPVPTRSSQDRVSELSKLAENLLQLKITKEENSHPSGTWEMMRSQLNAISERSRKLTRAKQSALRDALSECDMVKIRPVKTTLESSTFLRSLALEKAAQKAAKLKTQKKLEGAQQNEKTISTVNAIIDTPKTRTETKPLKELEKPKNEDKPLSLTKPQVPKKIVVSVEKGPIPLTVQSFGESEGISPLASLSGIVSSIGKKNETKPQQTFTFGSSSFQKLEPSKDAPITFGAVNLEQKQEKPKTQQTFTFGNLKPAESIFGKKEPITFGAKPLFNVQTSTPIATSKPDLAKTSASPNITITAVTTTTATTSAPVFTFGAVPTNASSVGLPKVNITFSVKEQSSGFGTPVTSVNIFSVTSTAPQSSASSIFSTGALSFGSKTTAATFGTPSASIFDVPRTTSSESTQPTGFTFGSVTESKPTATTNVGAATTVKPTSETEEVDVVKVDEPVKKPETGSEKVKESPKTTLTSSIFGSPTTITKTVAEVTTSSAPPNVTVVSTPQSSVATTNAFVKPVVATAASTTATSADSTTSVIVKSTTSTATAASTFSFSKAMGPISFGQTATTTTATTTTSLFETPTTTTTSLFGQVSSTTPTTKIFGGSTTTTSTASIFGGSTPTTSVTTTPTTNIFGGSTTTTTPSANIFGGSTPTTSSGITFGATTPTKPVFPQATTPSSTTESVFGASTPTTNTFGQLSTPSTPPAFGQKTDTAVSQTANLFGQLLSESNRTVFGNSTSTPNSGAKLFGGSSIFGGGSSTTTSSSIFPQTTSIFGQPTTSPNIFGQSQTNQTSFFGQNICSPFGGGTTATSNATTFDSGGFNRPKFGERPSFGQTTTSTSIFGGSPNTSLFGAASSTTATNVFQTPTTSTAFGSASPPGPFSSGGSAFGDPSFGSPTNSLQKPSSGFGSPPVFGGGPAFGGSPTFGGSLSFRSMAFGSAPQGTFGQSSGSATFENLASQNTLGFGNLAQQSQNTSFGGSGFVSSSFENKPAFGGNSFSNWRSK